jgi:hypothetical protein
MDLKRCREQTQSGMQFWHQAYMTTRLCLNQPFLYIEECQNSIYAFAVDAPDWLWHSNRTLNHASFGGAGGEVFFKPSGAFGVSS